MKRELLYGLYSAEHDERYGRAYYRSAVDGSRIRVTCVCGPPEHLLAYKWPDMKFVGIVDDYLGSCDKKLAWDQLTCPPPLRPADRTAWSGVTPRRDDVSTPSEAVGG